MTRTLALLLLTATLAACGQNNNQNKNRNSAGNQTETSTGTTASGPAHESATDQKTQPAASQSPPPSSPMRTEAPPPPTAMRTQPPPPPPGSASRSPDAQHQIRQAAKGFERLSVEAYSADWSRLNRLVRHADNSARQVRPLLSHRRWRRLHQAMRTLDAGKRTKRRAQIARASKHAYAALTGG